MPNPIVCFDCEAMLINPFAINFICSCGCRKRKPIFDIKNFLSEKDYYWYDAIITKLGNRFDKYIENFGREGVIFTKSKNRGQLPARLRWIKKYSFKTIYNNNFIEYGTIDAIRKGIPLGYEQTYLMISKYLGEEDRSEIHQSKKGKSKKIKYLDDETYLGIRFMCNKYYNVANLEITVDDNEELVMFVLENRIDINTIIEILGKKKIKSGEYKDVEKIFEKYKKLS